MALRFHDDEEDPSEIILKSYGYYFPLAMIDIIPYISDSLIDELFYSLNINDIKDKLIEITKLSRSFVDVVYSLPNIRPQIIPLLKKRKKKPQYITTNDKLSRRNMQKFHWNIELIKISHFGRWTWEKDSIYHNGFRFQRYPQKKYEI
jgi:hypothetical protein